MALTSSACQCVFTTTRPTPAAGSRSSAWSSRARPPSGSSGLAVRSVSGRMRLPSPAASSMALPIISRSATGDHGHPSILVRRVKRDRQGVGGAQRAQPVGPFHHDDAGAGVVPPQLHHAAGAVQPPQVEMMQRAARRCRRPGPACRLGLGTSSAGSPAAARIKARARVDLPAPSGPSSSTASPGRNRAARRRPSASVAAWSGRGRRTRCRRGS